jgi:hypothetical protein
MSTFSSEKIVSAVVESWDFSYVVDRAVRAGMPKEVAPVALAQLKQFLLQCALLPEANLVPQSQACDDLWHEFIVSDTRAYFRFCNAVYGRYLHHDGVTVGAEEMDKARAVSTEVFGAGSDVVYQAA